MQLPSDFYSNNPKAVKLQAGLISIIFKNVFGISMSTGDALILAYYPNCADIFDDFIKFADLNKKKILASKKDRDLSEFFFIKKVFELYVYHIKLKTSRPKEEKRNLVKQIIFSLLLFFEERLYLPSGYSRYSHYHPGKRSRTSKAVKRHRKLIRYYQKISLVKSEYLKILDKILNQRKASLLRIQSTHLVKFLAVAAKSEISIELSSLGDRNAKGFLLEFEDRSEYYLDEINQNYFLTDKRISDIFKKYNI